MATVRANGTELYYEVRGSGPPVLLIMGATGDAGHFEVFADLLADEFMVVSYDRRGYGRSPAPGGWQTTSPEEQADDAAALLTALGAAPAVVFGTSSGGVFALCLLVRHPEAARGAILHEPGLFAFHDDLDAARASLKALVADAMAEGGPAAAIGPFWRYVAGDDGWVELTPALRERMRGSAGTLFGIELGTYERYLPGDEKLRGVAERVRLLVSADGLPAHSEIAARLGERLGHEVETTAGTHAAYHDHPRELAAAVRPRLHELIELTA
jgi:pimeloyl-ACP methyl ester carboxylesterase